MDELRLGDVIDDYCTKCRRLTNHAIVSMLDRQVAKVRCRSCYNEHNYLHETAPPSKKDLKKAELFNQVLANTAPAAAADAEPIAEAEAEASAPEPAVETVPEPVPEPVLETAPAAPARKPRPRSKKA